jgi:hypothetical protein
MKSRPRYAENRIAKELTEIFGVPFERIPVLGRTGPDLTVNKTKLVIDVKSRQSCPKGYFWNDMLHLPGGHVSVSLQNLKDLDKLPKIWRHRSIVVARWLDHMHEWTVENVPDGISALVIHRPNMPYGEARLVFYHSDIGKIIDLIERGVLCQTN